MEQHDDESPQRLLEYWFEPEPHSKEALDERSRLWFAPSPAVDDDVRGRFGTWAERAARGELDGWRSTADGSLALILLLDQVPRQLHRGTAAAFAQDAKALEIVTDGIQGGIDLELPALRRAFFYMPLQHAESVPMQALSVQIFEALSNDPSVPDWAADAFTGFLAFAREHRAVIEQFGRFPHRNAALGRSTSAQEREYLDGGAPRYGQ